MRLEGLVGKHHHASKITSRKSYLTATIVKTPETSYDGSVSTTIIDLFEQSQMKRATVLRISVEALVFSPLKKNTARGTLP